MKVFDTAQALSNYKSTKPFSTWSVPSGDSQSLSEIVKEGYGGWRCYLPNPDLYFVPKFHLSVKPNVFTTGSCFAREIELALYNSGYNVLSWNPSLEVGNNNFHRYNTFSIINDFEDAFSGGFNKDNILKIGNRYVDWCGCSFFPDEESLVATRSFVIGRHSNIINSDVLIITLGLVEAWFDKKVGRYLNITPYNSFDQDDRYELRITSFLDNLEALQKFDSFIRKITPDLKIIVTVSPVPLSATFSGQDVLIANTYSKSVLRSVAQAWSDSSEYIDYFPSYELVTLADPDSAWQVDRRHVKREHVSMITDFFIKSYCVG